MEATLELEIKNNTFSRQFETRIDKELISIEYSFQEKKIFLTRINNPILNGNEEFIFNFLKSIMTYSKDQKWKVVPIHPKTVSFFKKNPAYKEMLPPGIRI